MTDRLNLPSASHMERLALCPGSWHAEIGLPDTTSPDATTGTRIHNALATNTRESLMDDEKEVADNLHRRCAEWLMAHAGVFPSSIVALTEQRLACDSFTGQLDGLLIVDNPERTAYVWDYKTGHGETTTAAGNLQLRAQAVLVKSNWPDVHTIHAAIIHRSGMTACTYGPGELFAARGQIASIIAASQQPYAPRTPHPLACMYCKAKGTSRCPETQECVPALAKTELPLMPTGEQLAALLVACERAESVIEKVRAEAKSQLAFNPDAIPGWTLEDNGNTEKITDPQTVYSRSVAKGATHDALMGAVTFTKSGLKTALKATGLAGKALTEALNEILAGCTVSKPKAKSLAQMNHPV